MKLKQIATDVEERRRRFFEHGKKTNGYDFTAYRNQIMTEEQRKLGEDIMRNFRESYKAKEQAGVFEDMKLAEAYWSGEFANKTSENLANTNIINANIETQVVDMLDQNIDIEPRPYDPSDAPYVPRVRKISDKILEVNKMSIKIEKHMRRVKKFGNGWLRALYNPTLLEGIGCPEITSVSPANIFPDASVTSPDDINKGRYFIEVFTASTYWAEQTFGMEKACAIYPGFKPYNQDLSMLNSEVVDTSAENYLHMLYWTKYKDKKTGKMKLRLIQCSGCGVILKDSLDFSIEKDIDAFPSTTEVRYPYWLMNDMEVENSIWGKSNASLLYPIQDLIDELDNQIVANARLNGNPKRLVTTSSGIDPDTIDNREGQVIVSATSDGIRTIEAPNMPAYITNRRTEALNSERIIVSRVSDQQSGLKQSGVDTATEALALQQNAMKSIDAAKTKLQIILADILMYCIELAIEFWDKEMYFEAENEGEFDYFTPSMLKDIPEMIPATPEFRKAFKQVNPNAQEPQYMERTNEKGESYKRKIHVLLSVSVGAGLPKNKALMYNIIKETYANGAMSQEEYRQKLEEYVGLPYDEVMMQQEKQQAALQDQVNIPLGTQSRNVFNGGTNPAALDRMQEQRTGGNYNVTK